MTDGEKIMADLLRRHNCKEEDLGMCRNCNRFYPKTELISLPRLGETLFYRCIHCNQYMMRVAGLKT